MKPDMSPASISDAVRAEAAAWVARLHSSGRSRALEAGLRRWLKADPVHARAFELATEAWEIGGSVSGMTFPRIADPFQERKARRDVVRSYLALAAALSAVTIGVLLYAIREKPAVTTSVGEQRMLTLDDGTRIFLNTATRLFVHEDANHRRVQLDSGEALFDVTKDPHRPFIVTVGDKEVMALGTSFVVRSDPRQLSVTLMEGKVVVSAAQPDHSGKPAGESATVLTPGQRLVYVNRKSPMLDEPPIEQVTAWRRGEVILDKTRLQDAADEMNRYSAIKLVIDDPQAADIRVSGIFRAGDSTRFAQAVGETYHLVVEHEQRRILISGVHP